jgi:6-pyruvoyl-tetrahydropterin synthase
MGSLTTGVGGVISASHRDQRTGQLHGHSWEVTAWFKYDGTNEGTRRHTLDDVIKGLDHKILPDSLAWGEKLAEHIGESINRELERKVCVEVDIGRPLERIYAKWTLT